MESQEEEVVFRWTFRRNGKVYRTKRPYPIVRRRPDAPSEDAPNLV